MNTYILIIVFVVVVIGAVFIVFDIPFNADIEDNAEWKTYRNEEYGFEIQHPSDTEIRRTGDTFTAVRGDIPIATMKIYSDSCDTECFEKGLIQWWPKTKIKANEAIIHNFRALEIFFDEVGTGTVRKETYITDGDRLVVYFVTENLSTVDESVPEEQKAIIESFRFVRRVTSYPPSVEKPGWDTYQNDNLGFRVSYPTDVFRVAESDVGLSLLSVYSITDNPSGLPGKEIVHVFSINFELWRRDILEVIKDESSYAFSQMFPDGTSESFKTIEGFSSKFRAADRNGFSFSSGAEGLGRNYFFLSKDPRETLVVRFNHFNNKVFRNYPASADISLERQNEIFNAVMATLRFLD